jgi:tRNA(fMet)-specific endonuclease VapC
MIYLLDTNTCIAAMRGHKEVCQQLAGHQPDDFGVSVVSVYELLTGVARCRQPELEKRKVEAFLEPLHCLPLDAISAGYAAKIRWELEKQGEMIGPYDLLLAGQALALGITLISGNLREFQRVQDLTVESWGN